MGPAPYEIPVKAQASIRAPRRQWTGLAAVGGQIGAMIHWISSLREANQMNVGLGILEEDFHGGK